MSNVPDDDAVTKFAGVTWREHASGELEGEDKPLSRTGNPTWATTWSRRPTACGDTRPSTMPTTSASSGRGPRTPILLSRYTEHPFLLDTHTVRLLDGSILAGS